MKNSFIKIISLVVVLSTIFGLCACKKDEANPDIITTRRAVTSSTDKTEQKTTVAQTVAAKAPVGEEDILKYYNDSIKIFRNRTYDFTRSFNCSLTSCSLGSLTSVTGATDSYKTTLRSSVGNMMGVSKLDTAYYVGDDISSVFTFRELDDKIVDSMNATANGDKVTIEIKLKQLSSDAATSIAYLTNDYPTVDSFSQNISSYKITADSPTVKSSDVRVKIVVNDTTKNYVSIEISYKTNYSIKSLNLGYISGGPVTGSTQTKIVYNNFKEV